MKNPQCNQGDEVDLMEYINVLIKRKKLVLQIFIIGVIISSAVIKLMPKVYEISSTIQLGSVSGFLISKEEAKEIILSQNSLQSIIKELGLKIEIRNLQDKIEINDVSGTNLLMIKLDYFDIDTLLKINEAVLKPLLVQGQALYQEKVAIIHERLKELDAEIKNSEGDIARTQALISGLPNSNNIAQSEVSLRIILLQNTLPDYESTLSALRNQRNALKLALVDAKDFKVIDQPIRPNHPRGGRKIRNAIIAGFVSLILGVFAGFFAEFWQKNKAAKVKI
jgi:uncharacterized protein involved in exopolysaccharide biosynthesis